MPLRTNTGLRAAQRHWMAILVIAVLAMVGGYYSSFLLSPTYVATSRVLVRARDVHYLDARGQDLTKQAGVIDSVLAKSLTDTSSGLIQSQGVAEQVVNALKLDLPKPQDQSLLGQLRHAFKQAYTVAYAYIRYGFYSEPPAHKGAVRSTQQALSATPVKDSYLIDIQAKADDPVLAASMANTATSAFVDASRARVQDEASRYRGFLQSEVDRARSAVDDAQAAVANYKQSAGILNIDEQTRLAANSLTTARKDLSDTDAQLQDAQARVSSLQDAISTLDPTNVSTQDVNTHASSSSPQTVTGESNSLADPSTSTIETGRSKTTTTADGVASITHSSQTTTQSSQSDTSESTRSTAPNKVYQDVQTQLLQAQAQVAGLQARHDALSTALADRTKSSDALPGQDQQLAGLQLQVAAATAAYNEIRATYESASVNAQQQAEEISPVDQATPPQYPDKPWRWLFGLVGLILGLCAGFAIAYLLNNSSGPYRVRGLQPRPMPPTPAVPALASSLAPMSAPGNFASEDLT